MSNDSHLPYPYPCGHPRLRDLSFKALGWLSRAADAAGSDRFDETIVRARLDLSRAYACAKTPAQRAVLDGLSTGIDAVVAADAELRELLADAVTGITEACAQECDQLLKSAEGSGADFCQ